MCQPQVRLVLQDGLLQHVNVGRAHTIVDVEAIRAAVNSHDVCSGLAIRFRGSGRCRSIGTIHHYADAIQWVINGRAYVRQVAFQRIVGLVEDASDCGTSWSGFGQLQHRGLDGVFHIILQLAPTSRKELNAVIWHWVVGGGDHHAHVGTEIIGEEGYGRGRDHADVQHIHALRGHACRQRSHQHLPRYARIAADHGGGAAPAHFLLGYQHARGGGTQLHRQRRSQLLVRQAAHTISSEQFTHGAKCYPVNPLTLCLPLPGLEKVA